MAGASTRMGDWSRYRELTEGPPSEYIAIGQVGHIDTTPEYVRLVDGRLLVEVTMLPSGDQVIATVDTAGGQDNGFYMPLVYGQRVVLAFPGGDGSQPIIVARLNDGDMPLPARAIGQTGTAAGVPMYAFLRTGDGHLLLIQSGDGADIIIKSGGSAQVQVDGSDQILLSGRTHIGQGAQFVTEPQGAGVTAAGFTSPGVPAVPYLPDPNTNAVIPPIPPKFPGSVPFPVPADGVVRVKDPIQSNVTIDPAWWAYVTALTAFVAAWVTETTAAGLLAPLYPNTLAAGATVASTAAAATTITSLPADGSLNTCSDT